MKKIFNLTAFKHAINPLIISAVLASGNIHAMSAGNPQSGSDYGMGYESDDSSDDHFQRENNNRFPRQNHSSDGDDDHCCVGTAACVALCMGIAGIVLYKNPDHSSGSKDVGFLADAVQGAPDCNIDCIQYLKKIIPELKQDKILTDGVENDDDRNFTQSAMVADVATHALQ